jgi:hypothetical protein
LKVSIALLITSIAGLAERLPQLSNCLSASFRCASESRRQSVPFRVQKIESKKARLFAAKQEIVETGLALRIHASNLSIQNYSAIVGNLRER